MQFQHFEQAILFQARTCLNCHRIKVLWLWSLTVLLTTRPWKQKGDCWCGSAYSHCTYSHILDDTPQRGLKILRGPGFLAVVWFGSTPNPLPLYRQKVAFLSQQSSCVSPVQLTYGKGGKGAVEPNRPPKESLALYKWFNTLWRTACRKNCCSPHISLLPTNTFMALLKNIEN